MYGIIYLLNACEVNCIMKLDAVLKKLESYKAGTFIKIGWEREIGSAKAKKLGLSVVKRSEGVFRIDIAYDNLKAMQGVERNTEYESWFKHSSLHNAILESKKDESKKYLQVFTGANTKVKTQTIIAGEQKDIFSLYEDGLVTKAALPNNNEAPLTFTLSLDNIITFG